MAKITRIKMEGVFEAIFCPKDEKMMTPNAIGRKYGHAMYPVWKMC
jgi:hypothetical protein